MTKTPGETPVERRLELLARWVARDPGALTAHGTPQDAAAINAGREAIALLNAPDFLSTAWYPRRAALLARCEETR